MRLKAEFILSDINKAIERHKDSLQAEEFRLSWFTIVGLLRSVGHVLDKVDSKSSLELETIINKKYQKLKRTRPEPAIFWEFIDSERNRFLKEYEHSVDRGVYIGPIQRKSEKNVFSYVDQGRNQNVYTKAPSGKEYSIISTGHFKGENEKKVALRALKWWEKYINDIKKEANLI